MRTTLTIVAAFLSAFICLAAVPALPAHAEQTAIKTDQKVCGGADLYAETEKSDPKLFAAVSSEAKTVSNTEAILWRIEKPGLSASHLFGTIHISDPRVTTMLPKARESLEKAETVALEYIGGEDAAVKSMMEGAGDILAYTDGQTLDDKLTKGEIEKVQKLVEGSGMPGDMASYIRPWFVSVMLALSDCERKKLEGGAQALDTMIEAKAKARGAKLVGLETPESQLKALASVPENDQIQMLKAGLIFVDQRNDSLETLIQMYLKRNIGAAMPFNIALAEKRGIARTSYDSFVRILLTDRNSKMRDSALPLLDKGNAFIAVGAMHLVGNSGLVQLLRDKGFTVTAVE